MHTGKVGTTSKTVAMFCPSQSVNYADEDTSDIVLDADGNIIPFTRSTIYLGTEISDSLDSTADVERRIKKASNMVGALRELFTRRDIGYKDKGTIYKCLCLSILLYGSECWCMTETLMGKLRSFHALSARIMCGVNMYHVQQHHITTASLLSRLGLKSIEHYFQSRFLRWSGHVARMPLSRLPRKFLTSWIADAIRPAGHPFTSWVTTLVDTLEAKNISTVFSVWTELAQDRAGWFDLLNADSS